MRDFFLHNMPYVYFIYGLSFVLLGVVSYQLYLIKKQDQPFWKWISFFAFAHCLTVFSVMISAFMPDSALLSYVQLSSLILSFLFLVEIARLEAFRRFGRMLGCWVYIPLLGLVFGTGWFYGGLNGINILSHYFYGLLGGLSAAWVIKSSSQRQAVAGHIRDLSLFAGLLGCYAGSQIFSLHGPFPPASSVNQDTFFTDLGFPVQFLRNILIICLVIMSLKLSWQDSLDNARKKLILKIFFFFGILAMGVTLIWSSIYMTDAQMRTELLFKAKMLAEGVNLDRLRALTGTSKDLDAPAYQRLKDQLATVHSDNPDWRFIYFVGRHENGDIFFLLDSEDPDSKDYSPPGQIYAEASEGFRSAFSKGIDRVEGPYSDRWGKWITAIVPVVDPKTVAYDLATLGDARDMVSKAELYYRKYGRERFLKEVNDPKGEFHKGDPYAFVYNRAMTVLAHPTRPELVGNNQLNLKDWSGGKYFHREMLDIALNKGSGYVDYEYFNPLNKLREPKTTYLKLVDDLIICSGAYKGTGTVLAVMGLDINARQWNNKLLFAAIPSVVLMLFLLIVLWAADLLISRRAALGSKASGYQAHLEAIIFVAVGLSVTVFTSLSVYKSELLHRSQNFEQLASTQTEQLGFTVKEIRDKELEGLAQLFESSEHVTDETFRRYTRFLAADSSVKAWEWIPAVAASDRDQFEAAVRLSGLKDFGIWEEDQDGKRMPAGARSVYFPVLQVAPMKGNEKVIGFDLGSEPLRRKAMEDAWHSGLFSGTEPVKLVQEIGSQNGMLAFRPVFAKDTGRLRGFVTAVFQMRTFLKSVTFHDSVFMQLSLVHKNAFPQSLAVTWDAEQTPDLSLSLRRYIFIFNKTFLVTAYAKNDFIRQYPLNLTLLVFLLGSILTFSLAMLLDTLIRRREELEGQVKERTSELFDSKKRFDQLAEQSRTVTWETDPEGRYTYISHVVQAALGYDPSEIIGKVYFYDLFIPEDREKLKETVFAFFKRKESFLNFVRQRLTKDGRRVWISSNGIPVFNNDGTLKGYRGTNIDITERHKIEEEIRERIEEIEKTNVLMMEREGRVLQMKKEVNDLLAELGRPLKYRVVE